MDINIKGQVYSSKFLVMTKEDLRYRMILGRDFIKENRMIIDIAHKKIEISKPDKSKAFISLGDDNQINFVQYERVPLKLCNEIKIPSSETKLINVNEQISNFDKGFFLFEGIEKVL